MSRAFDLAPLESVHGTPHSPRGDFRFAMINPTDIVHSRYTHTAMVLGASHAALHFLRNDWKVVSLAIICRVTQAMSRAALRPVELFREAATAKPVRNLCRRSRYTFHLYTL